MRIGVPLTVLVLVAVGVTGTIDYGGDISWNVPETKPVAVLRVEGGEVVRTLQGFCGLAVGHTSGPWCPADG
ncbi:hypothetical protein [Amycolatopsis sp. PS_44_ISF1]|uniref:hypothetical protein n=1 Tax=Amycolatopsis sp. PS_44_ISF1 TaxID=2974917 RepID=UPI0028DEB6E7|nr:hypothetical protein [Amycolatopsis sp. PS_44_ISF1]MDT8911617.1 hypothetical protein [Amycolatopsis sp. PS_44_ISF1]